MTGNWPTSLVTVRALFGGGLVALILTMAIIDCRKMTLPDRLNLVLAATGLGQSLFIGEPGLLDAALGALLAFALLWSVAAIFRGCRGIDGLGRGDLKFSAAVGLWIGWQDVAPMLMVASCSALAFVAVRAWQQRRFEMTARLPFGPFLGLGATACWLTTLPQPWS
jgi:prepilin signal peptidase PulO-like enzyme (type II secretory pathway)